MPKYDAIPSTPDENAGQVIDNRPNSCFRRPLVMFTVIFISIILILGGFMFAGIILPSAGNKVVSVWQTSQFHSDRLTLIDAAELTKRGFEVDMLTFGNSKVCNPTCDPTLEDSSKMKVNSDVTFQEVIGFGGAFTEASAYNYFKLSDKVRQKVIDLYFGDNGIGYTVGRIHINSCDFSLDSYSFDDVSKDYELKFFDMEVTHDQAEIIPFIKAAMAASKRPIKLLASPWSPPSWMKIPVNGKKSMTGSAQPNGLKSDPRIQASWAKYLSLFITAYQGQGVDVWALTPQNEPEFAAPWEACAHNATFQRDFINQFLGPQLKAEHPKVLLLAFDHNKDHLFHWAQTVMGGDKGDFVDGMAFHWYSGSGDRLLDGTYGYDNINRTHFFAPDKVLMATEGCSCQGVLLGDWFRAERLGHDVIFDLNNWAQGWIDWNLIVDSEGGPNHLKNYCDASIITLPGYSDIYVQPKFYYMGHISKFIVPGSVRVSSSIVGNFRYANIDPQVRPGLELSAFPCELSTRQMWVIDANGSLRLSKRSVDTDNNAGTLLDLCVTDGDENRNFLKLSACETVKTPLYVKVLPSGQLVDTMSGHCIDLAGGVLEAGALVKLAVCKEKSLTQVWSVNPRSGEMVSNSTGLCITAGWPFLTGTAFLTPAKQTVLVIMNEAPVDTPLIIEDAASGTFISGINARSIQTVVY